MPAIGLRFAYAPVSPMSEGELDALWTVYGSFFDTDRAAFDLAVGRADEVLRRLDGNPPGRPTRSCV